MVVGVSRRWGSCARCSRPRAATATTCHETERVLNAGYVLHDSVLDVFTEMMWSVLYKNGVVCRRWGSCARCRRPRAATASTLLRGFDRENLHPRTDIYIFKYSNTQLWWSVCAAAWVRARAAADRTRQRQLRRGRFGHPGRVRGARLRGPLLHRGFEPSTLNSQVWVQGGEGCVQGIALQGKGGRGFTVWRLWFGVPQPLNPVRAIWPSGPRTGRAASRAASPSRF